MSHYLGYNAMQDFFPTMMMKPNDGFDDDNHCRLRQKEHKESLVLNPVKEVVSEEVAAVVHEENEWGKNVFILKRIVVCIIHILFFLGISLVDESVPVIGGARTEVASGIHVAYDLPAEEDEESGKSESVDANFSLEELMAQMKSI